MKYQFTIKLPIYELNCKVIIAKDIDKHVNKLLFKQGDDPTEDGIDGYTTHNPDATIYYIFYNLDVLTTNLIAHEASHLVDFILENKGIELVGETRAYIMGYIMEQILKYVHKKRILKDKWITNGQTKTEHIHQHGT
jgi:hypothetical protein